MDTAGPIAILRRQLLQAMAGNAPDPLPGDLAGLPLAMPSSALDSLRAAHALGEVARHAEPAEHPGSPPFFQGAFRPREAALAMAQRRAEAKRQFVEALAALLPHGRQAAIREALGRSETAHARDEDGAGALLALPPPTREGAGRDRQPVALTIGGIEIELPESLRSLAREIGTDLGGLPLDYVASAAGIPGHAPSRETGGSVEAGGQPLKGLATYDEWDFRRKGFKKDWCTLQEKPVAPVRGTFVSSALARHRGLLLQLRRQFEMLRTQHRFLKRQAEGDDLDLDALTDSLSDARAGLPPSERVFIRLQRDARNVAAIFLVDMSASTEGWVSVALRESLLLMGEALHTVGDRFAMYGFSGMRRLRSDLFVVKTFTESFGDECKNRIAGILPQEYTRMGPPIRHATEIFRAMDASIRLLVVLSDGKPEDYDDYKGDYAIEDTRHALIEAKTCGIHPFCITIDRQARDAVRHMYGEVNYAFISDVRGLPRHLPAIYRRLTS